MEGLGLGQNEGMGLMDQAQTQYPVLKGLGLNYKYNPGGGSGFLEFWPGDETGTPDHPRPSEFPAGQPGVEVYDPKTTPLDILGDAVSHHMIYNDPQVKRYYQQFQDSMTPEQHDMLKGQYSHEQKMYGEDRAYEQWLEHAGKPAIFRGYPFKQWPEDVYTPEQKKMFDEMMQYLKEPTRKK